MMIIYQIILTEYIHFSNKKLIYLHFRHYVSLIELNPMDKYLNHQIVYEIFQYLEKTDALNFLSVCRNMRQYQYVFFEMFLIEFDKSDSQDNNSNKISRLGECMMFISSPSNNKKKVKLDESVYSQEINNNCLKKCVNVGNINNMKCLELMPNIRKIIFSKDFNENVDDLSNNVRQLSFGKKFNQTIDKLPTMLTSLKLGCRFSYGLDNLPETLVEFNCCFCHHTKINEFPKNIQVLKFTCDSYHEPISYDKSCCDDILLPNLKELSVSAIYRDHFEIFILNNKQVKFSVVLNDFYGKNMDEWDQDDVISYMLDNMDY